MLASGPRFWAAWWWPVAANAAGARPSPVIDHTGAGDAFTAAWLAERRTGRAPEEALRAACALAARVVTRPGARP